MLHGSRTDRWPNLPTTTRTHRRSYRTFRELFQNRVVRLGGQVVRAVVVIEKNPGDFQLGAANTFYGQQGVIECSQLSMGHDNHG